MDWTWLYKRIVGLDKGYQVFRPSRKKIIQLCRVTNSKKMMFKTTADSKTEEIVYEIEKMYD